VVHWFLTRKSIVGILLLSAVNLEAFAEASDLCGEVGPAQLQD